MNREEVRNQKQTLDYYNKNAKEFVETTQKVDFKDIQDKFLMYLPQGAHILDFGCGSGRDSKAFLEQGYRVTAIDGSIELCQIASEYIGQPVKHMYFQELTDIHYYDGIWACSSILHLNKTELHEVLLKIRDALKDNGILYLSFKYGDFEGVRNGRYFTNMTESSLTSIMSDIPEFKLLEYTITGDVRQGREDERWLNAIVRKRVI